MSPPPLDTPLTLAQDAEGTWLLSSAIAPIARGTPAKLDLEVPAPPQYVQAVWASQHYPGFREHAFPDCFVCGPHRRRGDGLRIFPGMLESGIVAAPWLPPDSLDAGDGKVAAEFLWAALDCPGYFAVSGGRRLMLLGEMQGHVDRRVHVGESCTVIGWKIGVAGRSTRRARRSSTRTASSARGRGHCGSSRRPGRSRAAAGRSLWVVGRKAAAL